MRELLDADLLGEDDPETPTGHQKDAAAKRTKETPEGRMREAFKRAFKGMFESFKAQEWTCLYLHADKAAKPGHDVGLIDLEAFLKEAHEAVSAHNREVAANARSKRGGRR